MRIASAPPFQLIAAFSATTAALAFFSTLIRRRCRQRLAANTAEPFCIQRVVRACLLRAPAYSFPPRFTHRGEFPILLDANENPHGPPIDDQSLPITALQLERYPDPRQQELKQCIATLRGCHPSCIFIGNGSDEVIDLLIRLVCVPGKDQILVCSPTYAMYSVFASINDVGVVDVPLTDDGDFQLRVDELCQKLTKTVKLIFLCSPGNPTSRLLQEQIKERDAHAFHTMCMHVWSRRDVEAVAAKATGSLVVVDEAYIDFALDQGVEASCMQLVSEGKYPNVVVSQTLSKAWGLAGARLGLGFACNDIVTIIDKLKAPFNLSVLAERVAIQALRNASVVKQRVQLVLKERERVKNEMLKMKPQVKSIYNSDANFLLVQIEQAEAVCAALAQRFNVLVRPRCSMLFCENCVRITIGTPGENDALLNALRKCF